MSDAPDISREAVENWTAVLCQCADGTNALTPTGEGQLRDTLLALRAALDAAEAERDGWKETARLFSEGSDGFRAWLVQIGELFGREAHIADDGSDMQKVLVAKVPQLVAALKAERDKLRAELAEVLAENDAVRFQLNNVNAVDLAPEPSMTPTRVIFAFALFCLSIAWLAWR